VTIVTKPIKPGKFDQEAFFLALAFTAEETGKDIKKDFEATTKTWKNKPVFVVETAVGPNSVEVLVDTDDEIYGYVTKGTRPHVILPKKPGGVLVFKSGYSAKTSPGVIGSTQGGSFGDKVIRAGVIHPGTQARKFDETIEKKWKPIYKRRMEKALSQGAKSSGHAI
jgi:hypothetical protein